jgi:hypothetical protein
VLKSLALARPVAIWQVALVGALAAFLGHGLLDYVLGAHAINILFWFLLGLATVRKPPSSVALKEKL